MTNSAASRPSPSQRALELMQAALALLDEDNAGVAAAYLQMAIEVTEARVAAAHS